MLHKFIAASKSVVTSTDVSSDRTDLMIDPDENVQDDARLGRPAFTAATSRNAERCRMGPEYRCTLRDEHGPICSGRDKHRNES
jgi:hypothetical protein